ncbi:MAG TPA: DUF4097 family beta strand repeat-containing protein, partial [Gemmatimonadaceae bacterium]|nr:DUF4097 family beta strand repeat-containing protein [Gemmatimonadaceae bacterium]
MTLRTRRTLFDTGALLALLMVAFHVTHAQTDRRTLSGDRVSIYNLAGRLRVQAGTGSQVSVEVTRGGRDASRLKVATGEIRGAQSLRVVYPSDRIVYHEMGSRSRTQLRVNSDGTFDDKDGGSNFFGRDRVEIRDSGAGLDAHADLVVSMPKGQRITIHWGVGDATLSNVDGDIRVSVAAATVSTEHTRGQLRLDTGSGGVTVSDAQGDVSLDTGSGGVTVNGMHGETLEIDTGSGSLRATDVDVRTLKADVGSGGMTLGRVKASRVNLDAGSGGVDIDLVAPVDDLSVDAGSG